MLKIPIVVELAPLQHGILFLIRNIPALLLIILLLLPQVVRQVERILLYREAQIIIPLLPLQGLHIISVPVVWI
jgi:hypothetical protein